MRRFILSLAAALAAPVLQPLAPAAIVMDMSPTLEGDYARILLRFSASEGMVGGFAGSMPGNVGFSGDLIQQQAWGLATPTPDYQQIDIPWIDSRFLLGLTDILSAVTPFETATTLGGAFTPTVVNRGTRMDLAELIVPVGGAVDYDFAISEAIGDTAESTRFSGRIQWEPNELGTLAPRLVNPLVVPPTRYTPPPVDPPPYNPLPNPTPTPSPRDPQIPPTDPVVPLPPIDPPFIPQPSDPTGGTPTPGPTIPDPVEPPLGNPPGAAGPIAMDAISTIMGDYAQVVLRFTASEGVIGGLAGMMPGEVGFQGSLVQHTGVDGLQTPTTDLNSIIGGQLDTQFLINSSDVVSAVAPFETSTELGGAFSPLPAARAEQMDLVQLVLPVGGQLAYNFAVSQAVGDSASMTTFNGTVEWQTNDLGDLSPVFVAAPLPPPPAPQPDPVGPILPPAGPVDPPVVVVPPIEAPPVEPPAEPPTGQDPVVVDPPGEPIPIPGARIFPVPWDPDGGITLLPTDWIPIDVPYRALVPTIDGGYVFVGRPLIWHAIDLETTDITIPTIVDLDGALSMRDLVTAYDGMMLFTNAVADNGAVVTTAFAALGGQLNVSAGSTVQPPGDLHIPEPASAALALSVLLALLAAKRRAPSPT